MSTHEMDLLHYKLLKATPRPASPEERDYFKDKQPSGEGVYSIFDNFQFQVALLSHKDKSGVLFDPKDNTIREASL